MDINQQLQPIVAGLIDSLKISIEQELQDKVTAEVINKVANAEIDKIVTAQIQQQIDQRLANFNFIDQSNAQLSQSIATVRDRVTKSLLSNATDQVSTYISQKLAQLDLNTIINTMVDNKLAALIQNQRFPTRSIPQSSINFDGISLSGDSINGGIIENFGSTGIEDRATHIQMTLMDHATAFEGPLWAPSVKVTGDVVIGGQLSVGDFDTTATGFAKLIDETSTAVQAKLNTDLFSGFSNTIFDKIKVDGLDLDRLTQGGKEVISGNQLGYHITDTNIQRVGLVKDLQTIGEAYLSETLYSTKGRVGVNTMEPSAALAVWDEEVEITVGKRGQNLAYIGSPRAQTVVIGSTNKNNITLNTDGSVAVNNLAIGGISMTSGQSSPNYAGTHGQIVWNEFPDLGDPIGWVCIGGQRWAKFGILE